MTFRERDQEAETNHAVPTTMAPEETVEHPPLIEDEAEARDAIPEEAFTPLPARGEDPVRLYLKEIGKVPLLTARQEVEIGRRIEVGQIALRRLLVAIPMALRTLLDIGDRLRHEQIAAEDVSDGARGPPPRPRGASTPSSAPGTPGRDRAQRPRRAPGQEGADGSEPPPRRLGGQALSGKRPEPARSDPGGQHRAHEGGRPLPVPPRLQVLDVRDVVDPPGDHPRDRRSLADD